MAKKIILVVDDEEINFKLISKIFSDKYNIEYAADGKAGLKHIYEKKRYLAAVLLDIQMPENNGYQVLSALKKTQLSDKIPVIMLTGDNTPETEQKCYEYGAVDVIHKPFVPLVTKHRVLRAIELNEHKNELEKKVSEQTHILQTQYEVLKQQEQNLRASNYKIIDILCTIVEFRNLESVYHLRRIKGFTRILATAVMNYYPEYGLTPSRIEMMTQASAMHDIGKITVPDSILLKPGRLTRDEFDVMKSHTTRGCEIIKMLEGIQDKEYYEMSYDICRHHHERYDGNGYPDGLKGEDISIAAQIVSIADVYDALVTDRVYKAAFTLDKAYEMIKNGETGVFSGKLLTCFELCKPEMEELVVKTKAAEQREQGGNDNEY
jgi:putative two-component system response regulator